MNNSTNIGRAAGLAGLVLCILPGTALAQDKPVERVTELALSFDIRHDGNVARGGAAQAAARGLVRADQRFSPNVQLTLARTAGPLTVSLSTRLGYDFYRRNTSLNRENLAFSADISGKAGPCTVYFRPSVSRRQTQLEDIVPLNSTGTASVRNTQTVQGYGGELRCGSSFGIRPFVSGGRDIADNDNVSRQISNYRTTRYGGGLAYDNPVLGSFTASYNRSQSRYPERIGPVPQGYNSDRYGISASRSIGSQLRANASISYTSVAPTGSARNFRGFTWNASATLTPTPDLRITGLIGRDVQPSLNVDALYNVNSVYDLTADYAFSSRLSLSLNGHIEPRRYEGAGTAFGPALTSDVRQSASATLTLRQSPRLSFGLNGGYQRRNANGTIFDYDDVYVGLTTRFTL
ncbi:MAG: outer membrane beta-barrel protein [Sphingomonas sp.]|jgi:hypothetical protein